jgi:tetratricopeptide (TPR) repeat protein
MPEYILTGRVGSGPRYTQIVVARSADEAVRIFRDDGFTDVVLHTDDNAAYFLKPSKVLKAFSPRDFIGYRTRGRLDCMVFLAWKLYVQSWWAYAFCLIALAGRWWLWAEWNVIDMVAVSFLLFPIWFAIYAELTSKVVPYRRALKAVLHARWDDVGRHMRRVRMPLPPFERPFREAQALAGMGRLDEALDHFRPVADEPEMPHHMYWTYKALIYQTAREREKALECVARAAELAPDNPVALIDHALALLTVRNDVAKGRELLTRARQHALSDVSTPLCEYAEGVLAVKDRRPAEAIPLLESAAVGLQPFTAGNPAIGIIIARIQANLALAHAAVGDHEAARRAYRKAAPVLAPHDTLELARCREVLG